MEVLLVGERGTLAYGGLPARAGWQESPYSHPGVLGCFRVYTGESAQDPLATIAVDKSRPSEVTRVLGEDMTCLAGCRRSSGVQVPAGCRKQQLAWNLVMPALTYSGLFGASLLGV